MEKHCADALSRISKLEQKTLDTCKSIQDMKNGVSKLDTRLNLRINETAAACNQRIEDTMATIKRLFVAIMVSIIGGGIGFIVLVLHLYEKFVR